MKNICVIFFYTVLLCTVFARSSVPMNRTAEKDNLLIFRLNLRVYEKKIRKDPDNYRLYYERGNYYCLSGYYNAALADINKALQIQPSYEEALLLRGMIFICKAQYKDCLLYTSPSPRD